MIRACLLSVSESIICVSATTDSYGENHWHWIMSRNAPIALFVYNRPLHTRQTVEALRKNELASESDLVIFSDGPKRPEAAAAVGEVREYIRTISGFRSVSIIERDRNWGLANSVIDGVTRLCTEYGRVIVLEDDLIVARYFLEYMNTALERYQHDEKVMQVSGYMFPINAAVQTDAIFLPITTSWGWATWQRAWQYFDPLATGHAALEGDVDMRHKFNLDGGYDYFGMLKQQLQGKIDSWAIRWYLSVWMRGGLTLFPRETLVENIGLDGSGTHGAAAHLISPLSSAFRVVAYPATELDTTTQKLVYEYLKTSRPRFSPGRMIQRLKAGWRQLLNKSDLS
jgi:GT2 family glycosyltransferase